MGKESERLDKKSKRDYCDSNNNDICTLCLLFSVSSPNKYFIVSIWEYM